ncbi:hypothetical protein [Patulibacter minatonensis]|uniref:hypothetical protein n=1 Tax=Patulibacter minatonensis TaxID=298163 RepID=UPI00047A1A78|nr:hypothetical protein [Patulibacter minatonensis]
MAMVEEVVTRGTEGRDVLGAPAPALGLAPPVPATPWSPSRDDRDATSPGLDRDEHAARRTLRRQIAKLELQLSRAVVVDMRAGARGRADTALPTAGADGPRLQSLGDLEHRRDHLVERLAEVEARRTEELHNRVLLREMYRDPGSHRYERLETRDLAERGCRVYQVVPRFGLVGIMTGWWRVKVSSGCPLPRAGPHHFSGR